MTPLDAALDCIRRGWAVCPCNGKVTMYEGGYKNATTDEEQVRAWWEKTPNANPGTVPGKSGNTVVDIDTGLTDEESLRAFMRERNIPETFAVRTGKRPQYRVQLYFQGCGGESFNGWTDGDFGGDLRATWGHVMAPGSIHPESGEPYTVLWDVPLAPVPAWVRGLKAHRKERVLDPAAPITEWRNDAMIRILGKMRADGADDEMIRSFAIRTNETRIQPPLDEDELERIISNACKYAPGAPDPVPVLSAKKDAPEPVKDWREHYHTFQELDEAPPVSFLIDNFLPLESITAIAAPVGQRKSLIALNVAYSLCSGKPLFGKFAVHRQPERVLYLCPEMGIRAFVKRARNIGLLPYTGKTFFARTMNKRGILRLDELTREEVSGAVIIVDTLVRYIKGDENSSRDMAALSAQLFRMIEDGAAAVIPLHHSQKGTKESPELTLENVMRGSGELGASMTNVWGTRLQHPDEPYKSASYLKNVKPRDFEPDPIAFDVIGTGSDEDPRLTYVESETPVVLRSKFSGDRDGKQSEGVDIIKANLDKTIGQILDIFKEKGIKRGRNWVSEKRRAFKGASGGVTLTSE